jgi:hypothetical protein
MKTTRYMTLAAVLLGLFAVAPARADVSRAELKQVLDEAHGHVHSGRTLLNQLSPKYAEDLERIRYPEKLAHDAMMDVKDELNKTGPLDLQEMVKQAERAVRFYETVVFLADHLEDQADDADDDRNEDLAKEIRREYRRCKSKMRDFLKLID